MSEFYLVLSLSKNRMGANLGTAPAVDTPFRIKLQRCISIGIKHQINPIKRLAPRRIPMAIPDPAISAMTGTYRKISFFTPVLEVLVVEPVKFRARYAVTAGMIRSGAVTASIFAQKGSTGSVENETANGIATIVPRMKPFVEKSRVGINGSKAGKSTVPAKTAAIAASALVGPAR